MRLPSAFTLIELVVVVSIISLVFAFGFASYREFDRRQQLTQAVTTVKQNLQLAKQKALAGEKPAGCTAVLLGWRVTFSDSESFYDLTADCNTTDGEPKLINLPLGITASSASVTFKVLAQGTTASSNVTITLTGGGVDAPPITVTPEGSIY